MSKMRNLISIVENSLVSERVTGAKSSFNYFTTVDKTTKQFDILMDYDVIIRWSHRLTNFQGNFNSHYHKRDFAFFLS